MGTWPIYKKHFLQLILTKKNCHLITYLLATFIFFPIFSFCTCFLIVARLSKSLATLTLGSSKINQHCWRFHGSGVIASPQIIGLISFCTGMHHDYFFEVANVLSCSPFMFENTENKQLDWRIRHSHLVSTLFHSLVRWWRPRRIRPQITRLSQLENSAMGTWPIYKNSTRLVRKMAWYKILIQVLIVLFLRITMCVHYWWCTKHAQLIMGTWPIYKKHFLQLILTNKNFHLIKYLITTFIFFSFLFNLYLWGIRIRQKNRKNSRDEKSRWGPLPVPR